MGVDQQPVYVELAYGLERDATYGHCVYSDSEQLLMTLWLRHGLRPMAISTCRPKLPQLRENRRVIAQGSQHPIAVQRVAKRIVMHRQIASAHKAPSDAKP
jgi:hypothetical protein